MIEFCPFCCGIASLKFGPVIGMAGSQTWNVWVECEDCKAKGPSLIDGAFQPEGIVEKAKELWNKRCP